MGTETAISLFLAAGFVATLGILIKYRGMLNLIAGYDPERVTDREGLADFIGTNTLYIAVASMVVAITEYVQPLERYRVIWLPYLLGVVLLTVRMVRGARRYETAR
ncbi:DUF3784 domain-containing protein [Haloglomus salinum]|jgi:hypothetical protein|uniref:DUF3784 domain-containing protein n=1 Tax=Haloglomus salinum TaxID=2962673 RepID=UPI0020C9A9AA|nr:DUF3784 domain-containing protein [Haloglomus salinum]